MNRFFQVNRAYPLNAHIVTTLTTTSTNSSTLNTTTIYHEFLFVNTYNILNNAFLFLIFPVGILISLCHFTIYVTLKKTGIPSFFSIAMSISNLINMTLYFLTYFTINPIAQTTLATHSNYTCKLHAYIFHLFTTYVSWNLVFYLSHVRLNLLNNRRPVINQQQQQRPNLRPVGCLFLLLALVYSIDIFFVEKFDFTILSPTIRTEIIEKKNNSSATPMLISVCWISDRTILLVRDLVDVAMCYLVPLLFTSIQVKQILCDLNDSAKIRRAAGLSEANVKKLSSKFRSLPFAVSVASLPVFFFTLFLNNTYSPSSINNDYYLNWKCLLFALSVFLHQLRYAVVFISFYSFDKKIQKTLLSQF